jgi:hypothetical protein
MANPASNGYEPSMIGLAGNATHGEKGIQHYKRRPKQNKGYILENNGNRQ